MSMSYLTRLASRPLLSSHRYFGTHRLNRWSTTSARTFSSSFPSKLNTENGNPHHNYRPQKSAKTALGLSCVAVLAYRYMFSDTNGVAYCAGSGVKNSNDGNCDDKCPPESICLHKMDREEEMIIQANKDLENALQEIKPKAMEKTEAALKAYCEAVEIIEQFINRVYGAMEQDGLESPSYEQVWCCVYEWAAKRCDKVKEATRKGQCAWELLCRLRSIVENGKSCKYTSCHPLLITAEDALLCAERELLNAKAKMECVQSDSTMVEQYRKLIEDFRHELKTEMEALKKDNPECNPNETECSKIITHAYNKVLVYQKELAFLQLRMGKVPEKQAQTMC